MPINFKVQCSLIFSVIFLLSACERTPPDTRAAVTLPVYTQGDADRGAIIYKEACSQCHQLTPGLNKKGPQLMNVYGAPAAQLKDYDYGDALAKSGWVWNAETLDPYIADAELALPESKMLADPMPDASERADVIAYLSTLRADPPAAIDTAISADDESTTRTDNQSTKMANGQVEIMAGEENKPAASFQ